MSPYRDSAPLTQVWNNFDLTISDAVATVTFNRPDKLNALTFGTYADLRDLLTELPHHQEVKVLVITGEGRGFCSGGDVEEIIAELLKLETHELLEFARMTSAVVKLLREIPIPVIVAVNARHRPRQRDRARGDHPSPADAQQRLRRVLRRLERGPQAAVERHMNEIVNSGR